MASVRGKAIVQLKTTLEALIASGDLRAVSFDPQALESTNEYPCVWIVNGADLDRDLAGTRQDDFHYVEASAFVRIFGDREDASMIERLEDLGEKVIKEIVDAMSTFRALTPQVHITEILIAEDPNEDMQRDLGILTVEVTYKGG
jgi:hypothetical protein